MLKVAVCDDNAIHLSDAEKRINELLAEKHVSFRSWSFTSAEALLGKITDEDWQPDIAVLDIEMDGEDGISLARKLNEKVPQCRIIFLTSFIEYAPEVYVSEHIWFVVKSRVDDFFKAAVDKALLSIERGETAVQGIMVRENGKKILIPLEKIIYIGRVARKAHICCVNGDYYDPRRPADLIPEKISDFFIRCHQGYWVNHKMIEELDHEEFVLRGGIRIPIGRTFRDEARGRFLKEYKIE